MTKNHDTDRALQRRARELMREFDIKYTKALRLALEEREEEHEGQGAH